MTESQWNGMSRSAEGTGACGILFLSFLLAGCSSDAGSVAAQPGSELGCTTSTSSKPCSDDPNPCAIRSGYPGDEFCMLPPAEGKGMQIHFGPSDYTDPVEVAKYVLSPGQEVNTFAIAKFPADQERWFNHVKIQMRPGSHHVVDSLVRGDFPEGLVEDVQCPGDKVAGFPGTQTLVTDSPPSGVPAPENVGIGQKIPGDVSMCVNHHGYNLQGDEGTLRELWINLWFVEPDAVTQEVKGVFLSAGPYKGIPPQSKQVLTYTADVPGDGRIVSLLGHRHAYTERFLVKVNDGIVYDSWSWQEAVTFNYDSLTSNPPVRPEAKSDGATSGILSVKKGDRITIECDVNNTSNNTLTFKNQLYGGEMCLLFGGAVGTEIVSAF